MLTSQEFKNFIFSKSEPDILTSMLNEYEHFKRKSCEPNPEVFA